MSHCNNIRIFSTKVYHFLTGVFSNRLGFSEVGLTDHLVFSIVAYSNISGQQDVEIYKTTWPIESVYGNDIDLFVQNNSGTFNWYALQAKVMSYNGAFRDLNYDQAAPRQQWEKLLDHEAIFNSKTYYLLYSGQSLLRPPTVGPTRADCLGIPPIQELGVGIVETSVISNLRTNVLSHYSQLYFHHVFPDQIDSLRKLICCAGSLPRTTKQFNRTEIDTDGYQKIYLNNNDRKDSIENDDEKPTSLKDGFAPVRIIMSAK